jgi:hypothetical protein
MFRTPWTTTTTNNVNHVNKLLDFPALSTDLEFVGHG